jgi:D-sedoheptulose 7-phosphate isomerase
MLKTHISTITDALHEHQEVMASVVALLPLLETAGKKMLECITTGGKVFFMGNGGSAADAQHLAAELIGRYRRERQALAAIALTTDSSILTALSNDYDYSIVFARQLEALCTKNDIVVGLSTSGNSPNVVKGIEVANQKGAFSIALTGCKKNELMTLANLTLAVASENTARIQEAHIFIGHALCEYIDSFLCVE